MAYDDRDDEVDAEIKKLHAPTPAPLKCSACGSDKIVTTALLSGFDRPPLVTVMADPDAVIFKGYECEPVKVRLCGECGYLALFADNPSRLYSVYLTSLKTSMVKKHQP